MHDTLTMLAAKLGDTGHVHDLLHRLACLAETNPAAASGVIHDATRRAGEALELQGYKRECSGLARQNRELRQELKRLQPVEEPMDGRGGQAIGPGCACSMIHNGPCPSPLAGQAVGPGFPGYGDPVSDRIAAERATKAAIQAREDELRAAMRLG